MSRIALSIMALCFSVVMMAQVHHRAPSSPAFIIAGSEPTQVLRPGSVSDIYTGLLSNFDENGRFTPDLGLEVAPYWLKSNPSLSWDDYNNPSVWQSIRQSFQLSAALVNDSTLNQNRLGTGFRFQLANGRPTERYRQLAAERLDLTTMMNYVAFIRSNESMSVEEAEAWLLSELALEFSTGMLEKLATLSQKIRSELDDPDTKKYAEALVQAFSEQSVIQDAAEASRERVGFFLEYAYAISFYQTGRDSDPRWSDMGTWLTASYITNERNQWTLTLRYLADNFTVIENADLGFSYSRALNKFDISVEAVGRYLFDSSILNFKPDDQFTYRLSSNFNYHFSDKIFVNLSLGKSHDTIFRPGGFFSVFGVNLDLFNDRTQVTGLD